jgi:hypothetical protein
MSRPRFELADIFRQYGDAWRQTYQSHINRLQYKVMSAIERCRSLALGGHLLPCENCHHVEISYNSCRNRHCPKCQARAAKRCFTARQQDLLPVEYYHAITSCLPYWRRLRKWPFRTKHYFTRLCFSLPPRS